MNRREFAKMVGLAGAPSVVALERLHVFTIFRDRQCSLYDLHADNVKLALERTETGKYRLAVFDKNQSVEEIVDLVREYWI